LEVLQAVVAVKVIHLITTMDVLLVFEQVFGKASIPVAGDVEPSFPEVDDIILESKILMNILLLLLLLMKWMFLNSHHVTVQKPVRIVFMMSSKVLAQLLALLRVSNLPFVMNAFTLL